MTADVELLPLPKVLQGRGKTAAIKNYARAVAEYNVKALQADMATLEQHLANAMGEVDRLDKRAERLAEALRLIAAPKRQDGTWNRDREACRQFAAEALRDHDQEAGNG